MSLPGWIRPMGDAALLVEVEPDRRHPVAAALAAVSPPGVTDVVPGEASVLVRVEPGRDLTAVAAALRAAIEGLAADDGARPDDGGAPVVVPTRYDGPDLDAVAAFAGMSRAEVIARHRDATYIVAFMGFAPGFAYLDGLPERLAVPRLATPRRRVDAGSVAIAGSRCCVYPQATPGGWHVIGHTDLAMFDASAAPPARPALLSAGRGVRFVEAPA